ncbi:MAG: DUF3263 domain-containing protein [Bifidobacteriaceae bacterium]|jgi:hypothetical protein|nr:DUF3263 domain-containing protein [Bifidobacteriaceae bacterium]
MGRDKEAARMGQAERAGGAAATAGLTDREVQILMFERQWWRYEGSKDKAIRELFEIDPTRYYQILSALLGNPAALAFDPRLVARLRRQRDERLGARSSRRLLAPDAATPTDRL